MPRFDYYSKLTTGIPDRNTDDQYYDKKRLEEVQNKAIESGSYLKPALEEAFVEAAAKRMYDRRSSQFDEDPTWEVTPEMEKELNYLYRPEDVKSLMEARSEREYKAIQLNIKDDTERLGEMAKGGWRGQLAFGVFSLTDPATIGLSIASGGLSYLKNATGMARVVRYAAATGLENLVATAALGGGNTQSDGTDLIIALGAGTVVGAAIGKFTKGVPKKGLKADAAEADAAARAHADQYIFRKAVGDVVDPKDLPIRRAYPKGDARNILKDMDDYEQSLVNAKKGNLSPETQDTVDSLRAKIDAEESVAAAERERIKTLSDDLQRKKAEFPEKSRKKLEALEEEHNSRIKALEDDIARLEELQRRKPNAKRGGKLYEAEQNLEAARAAKTRAVDSLKASLSKSISRAEKTLAIRSAGAREGLSKAQAAAREDISALEAGAKSAESFRAASKALKEWRKMSLEERVKFLYGAVGPEDADEVLAKQKANMHQTLKDLTEDTTKNNREGSVGAARAGFNPEEGEPIYDIPDRWRSVLDRLFDQGRDVAEDVRGAMLPFRSKVTDALHSMQARLSNSRHYGVRGWAYNFLEAPQGGKANPRTVAARVKNMYEQAVAAGRNRINEGLWEFGKEQGLSPYQALMVTKNIENYWKNIILEVQRPGSSASPAIQKAAKGFADQAYEAAKLAKEAGVAGMDNLELDKKYVMVIHDPVKIKYSVRNNGRSGTIATIAESYIQGAYKIKPKLAYRIAEAQVERALDQDLTARAFLRSKTAKDIDAIAKDLKAAGIEQDIIDDFMETSFDRETRQYMSNRAKKSLKPRLDVEVGGIKMIDLIDNDVPKLLDAYTREMVGGAAQAKTIGTRTRAEAYELVSMLEKDMASTNMTRDQINTDVAIMQAAIEMAYGRSINAPGNEALIRNLGRLKSVTSFLRLQFAGIASLSEPARITTKRSLSSVSDSVTDLKAFRASKHSRLGGKYSGEFEHPLLQDLERIMGYYGEESVLYPNGLRAAELEEAEVSSRIGRFLDNALAQGRRIGEVANGLRLIQGGGERLSVQSLALDLMKWMEGRGKALGQAEINRAGWHSGFLDELKDWYNKNPRFEEFNGRQIRTFNFQKMPPDMQELLQLGMHRISRADMQRPFIGETPLLLHKWLGSAATQFRTFAILSLEKQLAYGYRFDRTVEALIFMQSCMYSYMALAISSLQRHTGKSAKDFEEGLKNDLTGTNAIIGIMDRVGQLAGLNIGKDGLATLGALPQSWNAQRDQPGARVMTTESLVPILGLGKDLLEAPRSLVNAATGSGTASKALKDAQDVFLFAKIIGINQAITAINEQIK